jgi:hypothetical protein
MKLRFKTTGVGFRAEQALPPKFPLRSGGIGIRGIGQNVLHLKHQRNIYKEYRLDSDGEEEETNPDKQNFVT